MKIQQIRNATLVINYGGKKIVTDPWFQAKGKGVAAPTPWKFKTALNSPTSDLPLSVEEIMKDVDALIITHIHPDHMEPETAAALDKSLKVFVQNEADKKTLSGFGYTDLEIMQESGTTFGDVTLTKTKGRHGEIAALAAGEVCGVILQAKGEKKLYIAGDTVYYEEVENTLNANRPDIVVVNACAATLAGAGRLIMGKEDVACVCHSAEYATVIASHMEAVNHATLTRAELRAYLEQTGLTDRVLIPADGETMEF